MASATIPASVVQFQRVGNFAFEFLDALHRRGDLVPFPHQLLGGGGIVP